MAACPKCQKSVEGRPNFCPSCGASLTFSSRQDNDPLIGRTIAGDFKIEALVGEGAMGRVYKAQHLTLKKQVALKVLRSSLVSDSTVVKRFEREAQAASRLNHPNCISIFGFGQEDNGELLWMAMEFINGRDLGTIIAEDAPLATSRIVHIIAQVCDALDEAHSANVIHRDLKPANIVCFDHRRGTDFVKVLDFGIAKITDPGADYQPLTRDGIVCGTPAYMSPEQVQGFALDARSDLFSLGIILYQTCTGMLPFHAESAVEVATKIVIEEPKPSSAARPEWSYPAELEAIIAKLLQKKPDDRYANAHTVKQALLACIETLRARQDASLEMGPDEVAGLLAGSDDAPMEGAATLQLSTDMIARAMMAQGIKGTSPPLAAASPLSAGPPRAAGLASGRGSEQGMAGFAVTAPTPFVTQEQIHSAAAQPASSGRPSAGFPNSNTRPNQTGPTQVTSARREATGSAVIMNSPTHAFREAQNREGPSRVMLTVTGVAVLLAAAIAAYFVLA